MLFRSTYQKPGEAAVRIFRRGYRLWTRVSSNTNPRPIEDSWHSACLWCSRSSLLYSQPFPLSYISRLLSTSTHKPRPLPRCYKPVSVLLTTIILGVHTDGDPSFWIRQNPNQRQHAIICPSCSVELSKKEKAITHLTGHPELSVDDLWKNWYVDMTSV